ncbi:hypothetical protein IT157_09705 [bacterium]|nr:hypothetical protein [bacterium]
MLLVGLVSACMGLVLAGTETAQAVSVSGRFGLWSYLRDDSVDHVQVVPLLNLNVGQFAGDAWRFESTFRGFTDFQNGTRENTSLRIQRCLILYTPRKSKLSLRLGQQWLSEGVGRGNVAGVWGRYQFSPKTSFAAYGGSRLSNSISLDESVPDQGIAAGVNLRTNLYGRNLMLSYYYVGKDGDLLYNGAGLDFFCDRNRDVTIRARLHMNLEQGAIETGQLSVYWQTRPDLLVSADVRTQTPRIFEDSFFANFLEDSKTNSARGGAQWTFWNEFYATGMGYLLFTEEDMLYKTRAGIGRSCVEMGYVHWLAADKGDMDGFYGELHKEKGKFTGRVGFDYSRGSNSEVRPNSESQMIFAGLTFSPCPMGALGARIEHIKDRGSDEDIRALFSLSRRFSSVKGGQQ